MPQVASVLSIIVGITFAVAAVAKVASFKKVVYALGSYGLFPPSLLTYCAAWLIFLELAIAVGHLGMVAMAILVPLTVLVLAGATVVATILFARDEHVPCLCFGASNDDQINVRTLLRLGLLLSMEAVLLSQVLFDYPVKTHEWTIAGPAAWIQSFLIAATFLTAASWYFAIPEIYEWCRATRSWTLRASSSLETDGLTRLG